MSMTPEMWGIVLDMVGRNLAPNNAFAGVGTMLGQGSLAQKKATQLKQDDQSFWNQIISALSGKGQPGPTSLNVTAGQNGLEYTLKGDQIGDKIGSNSSMQMNNFNPTLATPKTDMSLTSSIGKNPNQTIEDLIKSIGGYQI